MRKRLISAVILASATLAVQAQTDAERKYVSDLIVLSVREGPSNDAGTIGLIRSGDAVTLLESRGEQSYARIRTEEGIEGWVAARYLDDEPAAQDQVDGLEQTLEETRVELKDTQEALARARQQLADAQPAFELQEQNDRLRAVIAEHEVRAEQLAKRYNEERERRETLMVGAGLVGGGVLFGLLLPWFVSGRRRRSYSDL